MRVSMKEFWNERYGGQHELIYGQKPKKPEMLYDLPMLRNDFSPLQEVLLEEKIITLSEGAYHKGVAEVVRFVGEKKGWIIQ